MSTRYEVEVLKDGVHRVTIACNDAEEAQKIIDESSPDLTVNLIKTTREVIPRAKK